MLRMWRYLCKNFLPGYRGLECSCGKTFIHFGYRDFCRKIRDLRYRASPASRTHRHLYEGKSGEASSYEEAQSAKKGYLTTSSQNQIWDQTKGKKPHIVNQQCVADFVGFLWRHLYRRIDEHKGSTIGSDVREQHNNREMSRLKTLQKCQSKSGRPIFACEIINKRDKANIKQRVWPNLPKCIFLRQGILIFNSISVISYLFINIFLLSYMRLLSDVFNFMRTLKIFLEFPMF